MRYFFTPRCGYCGKFCVPDDESIPYGCPDPEFPEPYDPTYYCTECFDKHKADWVSRLTKNHQYGDWGKSRAEKEAAAELELIWVGSEGLGKYSLGNMINHKWVCHRYVTKEEFYKLTNNESQTPFDVQ